jgi:hypothetical protein
VLLKKFISTQPDYTREPFMNLLLHGIQLVQFQSIKKKARIMVADSATLIGVVDTDGVLEEGEVFVQLRRDSFKCK